MINARGLEISALVPVLAFGGPASVDWNPTFLSSLFSYNETFIDCAHLALTLHLITPTGLKRKALTLKVINPTKRCISKTQDLKGVKKLPKTSVPTTDVNLFLVIISKANLQGELDNSLESLTAGGNQMAIIKTIYHQNFFLCMCAYA